MKRETSTVKRLKRLCLSAIILLVVASVLLALVGLRFLKQDYGVGVSFVKWLPPEARNITYLDSPTLIRIAEFEIAQEALEKWCTSIGKPLRKLGPAEEGSVSRCLHRLEKRGVIPVVPEPNDSNEWVLWYQGRYRRSFGDGDLFHEERWSNGGGYAIGYDVEEGKGYYDYAHH